VDGRAELPIRSVCSFVDVAPAEQAAPADRGHIAVRANRRRLGAAAAAERHGVRPPESGSGLVTATVLHPGNLRHRAAVAGELAPVRHSARRGRGPTVSLVHGEGAEAR
jgi:hypothetical protein